MQLRSRIFASPRPGIAKPNSGQESQVCRFRPTVENRNLYQNVFDISLGILDLHIKVAVLLEYSSIQQLIFWLMFIHAAILRNQHVVRKRRMRILVQILHIRMGWRAVEIEEILLFIFAVITFVAVESKNALLQDGVMFIP